MPSLQAAKALAGLALAALLAAAFAFFVHTERTQGAAKVQAAWDRATAVSQAAASSARAAAEAESQRRIAALQQGIQNANALQAQSSADAAGAADAAVRLRQQLAAVTARGRATSRDTAAAGASPTADDPIGLLADVLSQADDRLQHLAQYADSARNAGLACEWAYDSLTK